MLYLSTACKIYRNDGMWRSRYEIKRAYKTRQHRRCADIFKGSRYREARSDNEHFAHCASMVFPILFCSSDIHLASAEIVLLQLHESFFLYISCAHTAKKRIHSQSNAIAKMSVEIKLKIFRSYSFKNHFISRRYRRSIMEREKNRGLFESLRVGKTLPMWTMPYAWVSVCACGWCRACCQERTMSVAIWRSYWYEMNAIHSKHSN